MDSIKLDGLINIDSYNWSACISIDCKLLNHCIDKSKKNDIKCVYGIPKFKYHEEKKVIENNFAIHNSTGLTFLENISKHLVGESTPSLSATHCSLSTAYDSPTINSIVELEIGRVALFTPSRDSVTCTFNSNFGLTDGNTLTTTISSVTSTSIFDVTSVIGLQIGDRIRVIKTDNSYNERKIQAIAGNQITLTVPLDFTPTIGLSFKQLISRIYLIANGTGTLNTGYGMSIAPYINSKSSTDTRNFKHTLRFK